MAQDKLQQIIAAITAEADERQKEILEEADARLKKELERAEAEVLQESYELIRRKSAQIREDAGRTVSARQREGRKALFQKRDAIFHEVFDETAKRLLAFSASEEYPAFLTNSARAIAAQCGSDSVEIYLREQDLPHAPLIQQAFSGQAAVLPSTDIRLGGLVVFNGQKGLRFDDTLDTRLQEKRQWFMEHSGLTIG